MCHWLVSIGILNNKLGESEYREVSEGNKLFFGEKTSFLSTFTYTSSPKKFPSPKRKRRTPEERLRKYVELKYGKLNNNKNNAKKKQEIVEKKS